MNMFKSTLLLIAIGLLLSFSARSADSRPVITLNPTNHVVFSGKVDDESVAVAQVKLAQLANTKHYGEIIYLVIDSPGGSVPAGNRFIDFANSLHVDIKPICLFCASMGYHMFQSFGERLVFASSELMSHRVSIGGLSGQVPGEAVSRLKDIIATSNRMDRDVAKRIGISVEAYQKLIYDELWLDGDSGVRTNHADRIAKIRCSKELVEGKKKETVSTFLGPVDVTTSSCPLISGFLEIEFKREITPFKSNQDAIREVRKAKRTVIVEY